MKANSIGARGRNDETPNLREAVRGRCSTPDDALQYLAFGVRRVYDLASSQKYGRVPGEVQKHFSHLFDVLLEAADCAKELVRPLLADCTAAASRHLTDGSFNIGPCRSNSACATLLAVGDYAASRIHLTLGERQTRRGIQRKPLTLAKAKGIVGLLTPFVSSSEDPFVHFSPELTRGLECAHTELQLALRSRQQLARSEHVYVQGLVAAATAINGARKKSKKKKPVAPAKRGSKTRPVHDKDGKVLTEEQCDEWQRIWEKESPKEASDALNLDKDQGEKLRKRFDKRKRDAKKRAARDRS